MVICAELEHIEQKGWRLRVCEQGWSTGKILDNWLLHKIGLEADYCRTRGRHLSYQRGKRNTNPGVRYGVSTRESGIMLMDGYSLVKIGMSSIHPNEVVWTG